VIEPSQLALFSLAAGALVLAPGPDMLLVLGRALGQGRFAAILAALGCATGVLVLSAAVAFGLTAVLHTSLAAFTVMKSAGAAYLIYLGVKTIRERSLFSPTPAKPAGRTQIFMLSFAGNLVNPKVALFMFAFLPQFVDHRGGDFAQQILLLGCVYALLTIICYSILAAIAATLSDRLARRPRLVARLNLIAGLVFLLSGLRIATFEQPR
jgi:threonine/homoserine/homoserine lactone efflux protein